MSTTRYPGFPTVLATFAGAYLRTASSYVVYFATFSLLAVVVALLAAPDRFGLVVASVVSYALHVAAFESRETRTGHPTTLPDVIAGDSFAEFGALVVGLFVGYTAIYLASLLAALLVVGGGGSLYAGTLVAMYLPVVDFLGNRTRWFLSVQALAIVAYLVVVERLGLLTRVRRRSMTGLLPGYRFEGPTRTSTTPRR